MMVIIIIIITLQATNYLWYKIRHIDGNNIYHGNTDVLSFFTVFFPQISLKAITYYCDYTISH